MSDIKSSKYDDNIREILNMIKSGVITPDEGKRRILEVNIQKSKDMNDLSKNNIDVNELDGVAIIGMSGRFPGANNIDEFWQNISQGKSSVEEVPKERWDIDSYYDPDVKNLNKTSSRWGGFLRDIDKFDPLFFNISGMEAEVMDPQQRLFLEESWGALENAGYANDRIKGEKCGVYVAAAPRDYLEIINKEGVEKNAQAFWGNTGSILASRISYFLNLKGPAITVDTACSSSLVVTHLACQAILSGEIDMAIAGGCWICTTPDYYILTSNAGMLSADGKCKVFDNDADGIVNGEAVGAIVLKSLKQAVKDHDYIYGVIKSSGINQDGKTNGITAPSSLSQTQLEVDVYKKGKINPETISYVEAHGTGTKLGDPIEIDALNNAFKKYTDKKHFCAIGSVKSNIGHASLAAGIVSIIKVLLSLKYKMIPPSLNYKTTNENINFEDSPFYVNTSLQEWKSNGEVRRCAISSFGLGGTNAHLVIDEFCENKQSDINKPYYIATFSAKTKNSLKQGLKSFLDWSKDNLNKFNISDICYTLNYCRKQFSSRIAFIVNGQEDLNRKIQEFLANGQAEYLEQIDQKYDEELIRNLELYQNGSKVDWKELYKGEEHFIVPLPTYQFEKLSYWVNKKEDKMFESSSIVEEKLSRIHPLIDRNTSSFSEQKFETDLNKNDILINEYYADDSNFIPISCYIEMELFTVQVSAEKSVRVIEKVIFSNPVIQLNKGQILKTSLYLDGSNCYSEVAIVNGEEENIYSQAKMLFEDDNFNNIEAKDVDIILLKNECKEVMNKEQVYQYLCKNFEIKYSNKFKSINKLHYNTLKTKALAEVSISDFMEKHSDQFLINPALLEAAYQISLMLIQSSSEEKYYLSSLENVKVYDSISEKCFVFVNLLAESNEELWSYEVVFINPDNTIALTIDKLNINSY